MNCTFDVRRQFNDAMLQRKTHYFSNLLLSDVKENDTWKCVNAAICQSAALKLIFLMTLFCSFSRRVAPHKAHESCFRSFCELCNFASLIAINY